MSVRTAPAPLKGVERVYVEQGLEGLDENIDLLESYFKEMQKTTVETAYGPDDFLSFAGCAHYFGVIMLETLPAVPSESNQDDVTDEDAEGELEEDTLPVSRATSPPSSMAHSPSDFGFPHITVSSSESGDDSPLITSYMSPRTRSEQERDEKWEKYFQSDLQEMGELFLEPEEDSNAPFFPKSESLSPTPDLPHTSESSMAVDDCIDCPDEEGSAEPVMQEGPSTFYRVTKDPFRPSPVDVNFGREYLQSLPSVSSPRETISPVSPLDRNNPNLEALIYDAAIRLRSELRSNRVRAHEQRLPAPVVEEQKPPTPIGLIYLSTSQNFLDPLHMGECNMGMYIDPAFREKAAIVNAINEVTKVAFSNRDCHRLQAIIVDYEDKLSTLELLASAGFRHEGSRRHAFFSNAAQEWQDVTYFSMLATDWVYDENGDKKRPPVSLRPKSLWDDLLSRHQRECDDLVRLEEKQAKRLKRVASTETIREFAPSGIVLQKRRRTDSGQESTGSISSPGSSFSESLSFQRQASLLHSPEPIQLREVTLSLRSPPRRKFSDSRSSISSGSSFSNVSSTSDWEMLDDEAIGDLLPHSPVNGINTVTTA